MIVDGLEYLLNKLSIVGQKVADFIRFVQEKAIDKIMEILRDALSVVQKIPLDPLANVLNPNKNQILVNVWGSKDILAELGIGGRRTELLGFTESDPQHQIFNIKIMGADHFNYMRDATTPDAMWNLTVSQFVTDLLIASKTKNDLQSFFQSGQYAISQDENGTWVVKLTGWESKA